MRLLMMESIAGAVAREVERVAAGLQPASSQGAAYKAAWSRQGSSALKHCDACTADRIVVALLARSTSCGTPLVGPWVRFEAARGPRCSRA